MITQATYKISKKKEIRIPAFDQEGKLYVTFVPKGDKLYIDSDEYLNDEIVFVANNPEESQFFLDSLKKKG